MITKHKTFVFPRTSWRILKYMHRKGVNVYKSYISVDVSGHDISQCFTCLSLSYLQYPEYWKTTYKWIINNPMKMGLRSRTGCPIHILNIIGHWVNANQTDYVIIVWQQCRTNWNLDTWMLGMQTYRAVLANNVAVSHGVNMPPSNTNSKYILKRNWNIMFTQKCIHKCWQHCYSE